MNSGARLVVRGTGVPPVVLCLALLSFNASAAEAPKPVLTVLFTAEAHGALLPCACPLEPLGGVERRATLIKRYRERGPVVLVDAGGWQAGGIYDEESDGNPQRDQLRTALMSNVMQALQYDAFKGTPSPREKGAPLVYAWRTLKRGELTVGGIEMLTFDPTVPLKFTGENVHAPAPDFTLALAPVGEEWAEKIPHHAAPLDLIISAGYKTSTRIAWTVGQTVIANFDFQAQRLGVVEVFPRQGWKPGAALPRWELRVQQVPLAPGIPNDPEISALLAPHLNVLQKKSKQVVEIEFWTLPECPHCKDLNGELEKITAELKGRVRLQPHFLVSKTAADTFHALHGDNELREVGIQAVVARYYPERFFDWLRWRAENKAASWEVGASALGLLQSRLVGALAVNEHLEILEADYQLALRRRVEGTPTLVLSNRIYDGGHERLKILRALCAVLDEPKSAACKGVPACFHDAECRKRGFIGHCIESGKPNAACDNTQKAVPVSAVVLLEPEALYSNHERILEVVLNNLPGLEWRLLDPNSAEGKRLAQKVKPDRYPAYLLDPLAKTEQRYAENLGSVTEEREGFLVLRSSMNGAHRIAVRPRQKGRADLFLSRASKAGAEAVEVTLEALSGGAAPDVCFHDGLYWNEKREAGGKMSKELAAHGGIGELEDAAAALAVRHIAPDKFHAYLRARATRRASHVGWTRALEVVGIASKDVLALVEGADGKGPDETILKAMRAEADLLAELKASGEVVLLAENCELLPVRSRAELKYYLELIGRRRAVE